MAAAGPGSTSASPRRLYAPDTHDPAPHEYQKGSDDEADLCSAMTDGMRRSFVAAAAAAAAAPSAGQSAPGHSFALQHSPTEMSALSSSMGAARDGDAGRQLDAALRQLEQLQRQHQEQTAELRDQVRSLELKVAAPREGPREQHVAVLRKWMEMLATEVCHAKPDAADAAELVAEFERRLRRVLPPPSHKVPGEAAAQLLLRSESSTHCHAPPRVHVERGGGGQRCCVVS
eukprot:TRINITY_DN193_c7_g1_i1.p1 TRINITY_DN193_c7_g1~~TRINITY_DN193_c7_g1_i1.p1  ORF type:complete len:260 (+),score=91.12 TRINITY_DN193_c7_g1_i1:90-782(+)